MKDGWLSEALAAGLRSAMTEKAKINPYNCEEAGNCWKDWEVGYEWGVSLIIALKRVEEPIVLFVWLLEEFLPDWPGWLRRGVQFAL